jgi:hypothetical protein
MHKNNAFVVFRESSCLFVAHSVVPWCRRGELRSARKIANSMSFGTPQYRDQLQLPAVAGRQGDKTDEFWNMESSSRARSKTPQSQKPARVAGEQFVVSSLRTLASRPGGKRGSVAAKRTFFLPPGRVVRTPENEGRSSQHRRQNPGVLPHKNKFPVMPANP